MDAKVREILMKVKESAVDAGRSAGKVATDLVNQAKLNLRIVELNSEIESAYKNLGKMLYAVHNGIEIPADSIDETLMEIDAKKAEIDDIRDSLQKAKAGLVCPACGKYVGKKAAYCSSCGAKIDRECECCCEDDIEISVPAADGCCDGDAFEEPEGCTCEQNEAAPCCEEAPAGEPCCEESCCATVEEEKSEENA